MTLSLRSMLFGFFGMFLLSTFDFSRLLFAEQAAWGGNGGWWGGGNREWFGDYDGPGYKRRLWYEYPYCYPCVQNLCVYYGERNGIPYGQYYYDRSVPGAALYLNMRIRYRDRR